MEELTDADAMPFGKHKGERLGDVPAAYLLWFRDQDGAESRFRRLTQYIDRNRAVLEQEAKEAKRNKD